ncbi:MAG: GNAT family N-acetyltransferase [Chloroflexi bacterium]|nr:GNAT family N-acetyltransferase [Chloroflexota bacterium]
MLPSVALDRALARRLAVHEAAVHARGGRELRDIGDAYLLHDPGDPEPFWNRLAAPAWPDDGPAFDRRLDEVTTLFATLGRLPHIRTLPLGGRPSDLEARLVEAGFRPVGRDRAMVLTDSGPILALARTLGRRADLRVEAIGSGEAARAMDAARVLVEAFNVETDRIPALAAESLAAARRPGGASLLLFHGDRPVAAARRVTLDGATYLSSIGTIPAFRGRGYASLLTAEAVRQAMAEGTSLVHLLADAEMDSAARLYARLGFEAVGAPIADLMAR